MAQMSFSRMSVTQTVPMIRESTMRSLLNFLEEPLHAKMPSSRSSCASTVRAVPADSDDIDDTAANPMVVDEALQLSDDESKELLSQQRGLSAAANEMEAAFRRARRDMCHMDNAYQVAQRLIEKLNKSEQTAGHR